MTFLVLSLFVIQQNKTEIDLRSVINEIGGNKVDFAPVLAAIQQIKPQVDLPPVINFLVVRGAAPSVQALEQQLSEVKNLFEDNFGHSVDQEDLYV